jgi:uncharacterized protein (DUF433 family)
LQRCGVSGDSPRPHLDWLAVLTGGKATPTREDADLELLGLGLYTPQEASLLLRIPPSTLRRWLEGYSFPIDRLAKSHKPALVAPALPRRGNALTLTFLDLVQLRVVKALRDADIALQRIRTAAEGAVDLFGTSHPFASVRFKTDGRRLFADVPQSGPGQALVELGRPSQATLRTMLDKSLREISYATTGLADRWFVAGPDGGVVIDPRISFGTPVVVKANVPTHIIRDQARVTPDEHLLASWFALDVSQIRNALRYEEQLAA